MLTNAAGGLDPSFGPGTLMVMSDHINLTGQNPLIGRNADALGERFTDLTEAWSPRLRARLHAAGAAEGVELAEGVYVGLTGPNYETPAEVRMYAGLGGHAVGMSTVLECIAARWVGPRGLRRLAGDQRRRRLQRRAADPRGGPRGGRDRRSASRPRHPAVPRGPARGGRLTG